MRHTRCVTDNLRSLAIRSEPREFSVRRTFNSIWHFPSRTALPPRRPWLHASIQYELKHSLMIPWINFILFAFSSTPVFVLILCPRLSLYSFVSQPHSKIHFCIFLSVFLALPCALCAFPLFVIFITRRLMKCNRRTSTHTARPHRKSFYFQWCEWGKHSMLTTIT